MLTANQRGGDGLRSPKLHVTTYDKDNQVGAATEVRRTTGKEGPAPGLDPENDPPQQLTLNKGGGGFPKEAPSGLGTLLGPHVGCCS